LRTDGALSHKSGRLAPDTFLKTIIIPFVRKQSRTRGFSMERKFTPAAVARRYGVTVATVIAWCNSGIMPAVNVASEAATRRRWRMSDEDIEAFEATRGNQSVVTP
jgi:hypothetical protein